MVKSGNLDRCSNGQSARHRIPEYHSKYQFNCDDKDQGSTGGITDSTSPVPEQYQSEYQSTSECVVPTDPPFRVGGGTTSLLPSSKVLGDPSTTDEMAP